MHSRLTAHPKKQPLKISKRSVSKTSSIPAYPRSARIAAASLAGILSIVPFHAFLTVWGASFGLNYTLLRLWSLVPLFLLMAAVVYWCCRDQALRRWISQSYLMRIVAVYAFLMVIIGARGLVLGTVDLSAFCLGLYLNLRFLALFVAAVILVRYLHQHQEAWLRPVFAVAIIVAAFAVLQYTVLPVDFLRHFGYGPDTIEPFETINSNSDYLRVASTLRGANPLGAYMLVIISLLAALWHRLRPKFTWSIVLALCSGALAFSFSRSAWLGLTISLVFILAIRLNVWQYKKKMIVGTLIGVVVAAGLFFVSTHSRFMQNMLYHTDDSSTVAVSSNNQRTSALRQGFSEVLREPLGRGVGSAGPASVHNTRSPARIAENYFLQIGQEIGWFGLFGLMALCAAVGFQLWQQRRDSFALGLLAAFIGLFIVNMLSHAWTDDTLAYIWWGLAGVVIGQQVWRRKADER